jgi:hypothetical protein
LTLSKLRELGKKSGKFFQSAATFKKRFSGRGV